MSLRLDSTLYAVFQDKKLSRVNPTTLMASEFGPPSLSKSESSSDRPDATGIKRRRRSTVRVACNACRTKKTRCDGRRPVCSWCASHPGVHCIYDTGSAEETRSAALKRENDILRRNLQHAERLLEDLTTLPDHESMDLLKRIRGTDVSSESLGRNSTRDYVEPRGSAGNAHTSGTMRSIQPMLDGADLVTESHFSSSSATTINRHSPHDIRNVSSTSFGPPGFSLVVKRAPSEPMHVSNGGQREPNVATMRT